MADQRGQGGIAWTDQTWNPIRGCSRVSEGCRYCYAETTAGRYSGKGQAYEGLARMTSGGARWTGEVRFIPSHLADPLRWETPRMIFANSMSDLFHEKLGSSTIAAIFGVMLLAKQHTIQVLTKRPERMPEFFLQYTTQDCLEQLRQHVEQYEKEIGETSVNAIRKALRALPPRSPGWPLPNVWLGTSIEDNRVIGRLRSLQATPAAVRWVSAEPLLGPLDLVNYRVINRLGKDDGGGSLDWVVFGGESGRGARGMNVEWIRDGMRQARDIGARVFVKQLGAHPFAQQADNPNGLVELHYKRSKADAPEEWPHDLRVREWPAAYDREDERHASSMDELLPLTY